MDSQSRWPLRSGPALRDLPQDGLPVLERDVVRVVVLDALGRVLLLDAGDSTNPAAGRCWELPGGGIEQDETPAEAARRELLEETGLEVEGGSFEPPTWIRTSTYVYRSHRRLQHEQVCWTRLSAEAPAISAGGRDAHEAVDCHGYRWWTLAELTTSPERFYPGTLPTLIEALLRGEAIREPLEVWS